jgi:hypothetical protein
MWERGPDVRMSVMVSSLHYPYGSDVSYDIYQKRYRDSIRESDKVLIELIRSVIGGRSASLLDVGCSTGNLLRHVKRLLPALEEISQNRL